MKLGFHPKIETLNASSVEYFISPEDWRGEVIISLKNIKFVDPYGVIMLILLIKHLRSRSINVKITPPISLDVLNWLERMNFFAEIENDCEFTSDVLHLRSNVRNPSRSLKEITHITSENRVTSVVEVLAHILIEDYGFEPNIVYRLCGVMIETFQNIPQHSNPGDKVDPYGIAAIQSYKDHFYLVVGDIGVGIKESLNLNPKYRKKNFTNLEAIRAVLEKGASRFKERGRGGQIKRVCEIVSSLGGTTLIRSGSNLVAVKGASIKFWSVNSFPGTQIGIKIPHATLKWTKAVFGELPVYYAYFEHPDGSWYMLWMIKDKRDWSVYANYDKSGVNKPKLEREWYRQSHGDKNWRFNTMEEALDHFYRKRYIPRIKHGYRLIVGNIPDGWFRGSPIPASEFKVTSETPILKKPL
ncbi:MAG: hypothetical protein C4291_08765 [Candidatus Dadabacteria bacterium]